MESPLQALLREVEAQLAHEPTVFQPGELAAAASCALNQAPSASGVLEILLQPGVQGCVPDAEHVASCKERGAAAFRRGQFRQAVRLFGEALRYCDEASAEGALLAARLYCNRALALTKLHAEGGRSSISGSSSSSSMSAGSPLLEGALQDSSAAIDCDPSFAKAHYRRAWVLRALGRGAAALPDAQRAVELLQEQQAGGSGEATEAAALVAELEAAAAALEGSGDASALAGFHANGVAAPEAAAAASAQDLDSLVHLAGPQLAVQQTEDAGRCLAAAAALPAAADVLREGPFAHALTKAGRRSVCATCMQPLAEAAAPCYCTRCPLPAYCSAACREADRCHRPGGPECGRPWTVLLPAEALAALRLARRLRQELGGSAHAAQGGPQQLGSGGAQSVVAAQVAALGTHLQDMDGSEAAQLAALAAVAHATWQQAAAEAALASSSGSDNISGSSSPSSSEGDAGSAGITAADVLEALCRLQINGLAVVPPERHGSGDRLALALYPVGSLMNHSCQPNVAARFEGATLVVRTLEPLAAGAPLLHCYGPQVGEMTKAQRQALLQQQYHFLCGCRACSAGEGGLSDTAPAGLKCPGSSSSGSSGARCEGAVLPPCPVPAGVLHSYPMPAGCGACCACAASLSRQQWVEQLLPELQAAAEAHAEAVALLEQQERGAQREQQVGQTGMPSAPPSPAAAAQQAVRSLRQVLRQRQAHLHPHNLLLGATHDALAHAWHLAGGDEAAAQHLRHSLAILCHAYPAGSTAIAFQQRQLAQMLRLAAAAAAAGGSGGAAAAEQHLEEARRVEEEANAVLQLHFGPAQA